MLHGIYMCIKKAKPYSVRQDVSLLSLLLEYLRELIFFLHNNSQKAD